MLTRTTHQHEAGRRERRHNRTSARAAAAAGGEARTRAAGGPQDHAYYACHCGFVFAGAVSTHVACPQCGTDQAW
jgi:rubrerythrin